MRSEAGATCVGYTGVMTSCREALSLTLDCMTLVTTDNCEVVCAPPMSTDSSLTRAGDQPLAA